eukprot:1160411-Pelagomonas_calceolata.AAC.2
MHWTHTTHTHSHTKNAQVVLAHALIASRPPVPVMHPSMPPRTTPSPPKSDRPTTTSTSTTTSKTSTSANSMGRPSADKHTEECYVLQELNWEKVRAWCDYANKCSTARKHTGDCPALKELTQKEVCIHCNAAKSHVAMASV